MTGLKAATVFGKWDDSLHYVVGDGVSKTKVSDPASNASLLWKRTKPPPNVTRYNLTSFAITLNELTPGLQVCLNATNLGFCYVYGFSVFFVWLCLIFFYSLV